MIQNLMPIKKYLNRRLNQREALAVILVVAVVAALAYAGYNFVCAKMLEAEVAAAIPTVSASLRAQRQKVAGAIEAYKAHFGVYPPDHITSRQPLVVDAVTNWLAYELIGVTYDRTNHLVQLGGMESADEGFVKDFFHCAGFKNYGESESQVKHFLPSPPASREVTLQQFHDDPDIYALGNTVIDEGMTQAVLDEIKASSWRYVVSSPIHNPGRFDLWMELQIGNQKIIIGNWPAAE